MSGLEPVLAPRPPLSSTQRLLLSVAAGLAVAALATLACWQSYRRRFAVGDPQFTTVHVMSRLLVGIDEYRRVNRRWPDRLDDVFDVHLTMLTPQRKPPWNDEWGHPFVYEVREGRPFLMSFGSDGKPGGTGFAHDLVGGENPPPPDSLATLDDFLFEQPTGGIIKTCLLTGGIVFLSTLYSTRFARPTRTAVSCLVIGACFAVIAAVLVSEAYVD